MYSIIRAYLLKKKNIYILNNNLFMVYCLQTQMRSKGVKCQSTICNNLLDIDLLSFSHNIRLSSTNARYVHALKCFFNFTLSVINLIEYKQTVCNNCGTINYLFYNLLTPARYNGLFSPYQFSNCVFANSSITTSIVRFENIVLQCKYAKPMTYIGPFRSIFSVYSMIKKFHNQNTIV